MLLFYLSAYKRDVAAGEVIIKYELKNAQRFIYGNVLQRAQKRSGFTTQSVA